MLHPDTRLHAAYPDAASLDSVNVSNKLFLGVAVDLLGLLPSKQTIRYTLSV